MSLGNTIETGLLDLILNNLDLANIGDAGGLQNSATDGSLYLSLHTADPGEAGDQTTSEVAYTSYARVAVARSGAVWTVSSGSATCGTQSFPAGTGGSGTATYWGLGTASSGAGVLIGSGAITPSIVCGNGVTPQITPTVTLD